jgi:hypothetical protein
LFTAVAAWALYMTVARRWILAATLAVGAGLVRPTAVAIVVTVCLAAFSAVVRGTDRLPAIAALVIAPVGLLGYWIWAGTHVGRLDGWFLVQRDAWRSYIDGGRFTIEKMGQVLLTDHRLVMLVVTAVVVTAVPLVALLIADRRIPWAGTAYTVTMLVVVLCTAESYHSKARFLLPAFPILLPLAFWSARRGKASIALIGIMASFSAWFGGYLLINWPVSP